MCVLMCPSRVVSCTSWLGVLCGGVSLGLGWCRASPLLAGALGLVCVCVRAFLYPAFPGWGVLCGRACWARVSAVPRPSWLGSWGVCAVVRVPGLPSPFQGGRLWRGGVRVLPFPVLFFWGGGRSCVLALWCRSLAVPVLGLMVSVSPLALLRAALFFVLFFRPSVVCVRVF